MRVLITGSRGSLGRHLLRALSTDPRFDSVIGVDIREPDCFDIREPMDGMLRQHRIDAVVHAAFIVNPIRDEELMAHINVEGSRNVLRCSIAAGVRHFIFISSATVYGFHPNDGEPYTEDAPRCPNRGFVYGEHKCIVERMLESAAESAVTILRPSFLVTREGGNPLLQYIAHRLPVLPYPAAPLQMTHIEDMVEILRLVLLNGVVGVFNVGAAGALDVASMTRRLGHVPIRLPYVPLSMLNRVAWKYHVPIAPAPAWAMQVLRHPWIVSSDRLTRETGYAFRYTSSAAFEDFAAYQLHRGL